MTKAPAARRALVLASESPQRRRLLRLLGIPFRTVPSGAAEDSDQSDPRLLAEELARRKALAVARRLRGSLVLGADTLVVCAGRILGKPRGRRDSERMLRLLNGRRQEVYTGVALAWAGGRRVESGVAVTSVWARRLSPGALRSLAGKHMDKAGSYAVQDDDDPFIRRVRGDLDNVVGLPLRLVRRLLRTVRQRRPLAANGRVK